MKILFLITAIVLLVLFASCHKRDDPGDTGMSDPNLANVRDSVNRVNMDYGTDKIRVTVRKPECARFDITPADAANVVERVRIVSDDNKWSADVISAVSSQTNSDDIFFEYYFNGTLGNMEEQYDYFNQEITDLESYHMGNPVIHIKTTYKKTGDKNLYEVRFVGFEFSDKLEGKPNGKGLMGFKLYDLENSVSLAACGGLFSELFFIER